MHEPPMRLGLLLTAGTPSRDVELARQAEAAGMHSVYTVDFMASNALVRLAAISQATARVCVGTGIANTFTRSPMVLGTAALDINELSGGRLKLGLGTGLLRMNREWYAVPFGKPVSRSRELFALLRQLFGTTGPGFRFEGAYWDIRIPAYRRAASETQSTIPIWLAAVNRGMISAAGEFADGMVGHPVHSRRWHREVSLPTLRAAEYAAGRPEGACPIYPHLIVSVQHKREDAVRDAKRQIGFSFSVEHYHAILDIHDMRHVGQACRAHLARQDFEAMAACIPDALVDEIAIACTPDEFEDRLQQWDDITAEAMLFPASVGVPAANVQATLEQIFALSRKRAAAATETALVRQHR